MSAKLDLREYLEQLTAGEALTQKQASEVCGAIADGRADPIQVAALLSLIQAIKPNAGTVTGFAEAMRARCNKVVVKGGKAPAVDIVGTGGDGHNTVNISTSAAVVAACCGATVAKHGNASVSSRSGSADVLKALGIRMLPPADIARCAEACGMAFMFAPLFHPAMRHVVPVRRSLKIRTIFNILGPLLNPAGAERLMLGVYDPVLLPIYGEALQSLGVEHGMVVHCQTLDELAPVGIAQVLEVRRGEAYTIREVDMREMGVSACTIGDLRGGEPAENAAIIRRVLGGKAEGRETHIADTIALNAGAALYVSGLCAGIKEGTAVALEAIKAGRALGTLEAWAKATQELEASRMAGEKEAKGTGAAGTGGGESPAKRPRSEVTAEGGAAGGGGGGSASGST